MFTRRPNSRCLAATLRTVATRKIDCNSNVLRPESKTKPASGSNNCNSALRASLRTSVFLLPNAVSDSVDGISTRFGANGALKRDCFCIVIDTSCPVMDYQRLDRQSPYQLLPTSTHFVNR